MIEAEQFAAKHLGALLDETCQVEIVGTATHGETGMRLCRELRPEAVFLDINLPGKDGVLLANQLKKLPQPPRLIFTTSDRNRAVDAFRLEAIDYLLKPLDPIHVLEAVNRLAAILRPFQSEMSGVALVSKTPSSRNGKLSPGATPAELLPVKDTDNDRIRLLSRREIVAVLRKGRHTWIHTVREEFSTRYPLSLLAEWLGGRTFTQIGRQAIVNEQAIELITHLGDRLYRVQLRDRIGTVISASRKGASRLTALIKSGRLAHAILVYRSAARVAKPL
jgi:two-component system, LytTR family, response regulator LytT